MNTEIDVIGDSVEMWVYIARTDRATLEYIVEQWVLAQPAGEFNQEWIDTQIDWDEDTGQPRK